MCLRLSAFGQVWMRNFVTIGATRRQRFGVLLSKKASRLKTFDTQTASGLFPRLFFFMITGYFRPAGLWINSLIDGLERTSGSSAGSKLLILTRRTDRVGQMARMVSGKHPEPMASVAQLRADRVA